MGWICKICTYVAPETNELLRHYRLRHEHSEFLPCLHADCPCSFKTWNTLKSHLSRTHPTNKSTPEVICFSCELCSSSSSTEKDFFQHLAVHLRKNQTVHCVFRECDFSLCLSVCVYLSVYLSFCLSVCHCLSPPTSISLFLSQLIIIIINCIYRALFT